MGTDMDKRARRLAVAARNFAREGAPTVVTFFANEGITVERQVCEDAIMAAGAGCTVTFLRTTTAISDEFGHAPSVDAARGATRAALNAWKQGLGEAMEAYLEHLRTVSGDAPTYHPNDPDSDRAAAARVAELVSSWVFAVVAAQAGKSLKDVSYPGRDSRQLGVRLVEGFAGWWLEPPEEPKTWREKLDGCLPRGLLLVAVVATAGWVAS